MSQKSHYIIIEKFLKGELLGEELDAFNQKLKDDSNLRNEVEMHQLAQNAILEAGLLNVKGKLNIIHTTKTKTKRIRRILRNGFMGAIVLGTIIWLLNNKETLKQEDTLTQKTEKKIENTYPLKEKELVVTKKNVFGQEKEIKNKLKEVKKEPLPIELKEQTSKIEKISEEIKKEPESEQTLAKELIYTPKVESTNTLEQKNIPIDIVIPTAPPIKEEEVETDTYDCNNTYIYYSIENKSTCIGKASGKIIITDLRGGEAPYTFSIDSGFEQSENIFANIRKGTYNISVKDLNGCVESKEVIVDAEDCIKKYKFAPAYGEVWEIPGLDAMEGKLQIYDKQGKLVYQDFIYGNADTWDGRDINGSILPLGSYQIIIYYPNTEPIIANVTILN